MSDKSILYHYTTISGLNSIIRTGKVWASDCRYLNDQQELQHAIELLLGKFEGSCRETLEWAFHWHNLSRCHCVFSLSRSPKVLSQWRAYADDGRGAAIGFDEKHLFGYQKLPHRSLVSCIYEDHDDFINGLVSKFEVEIDALTKMHKDSGGAVNAFWKAISDNPKPLENIYSEILRIKNPAFAEEQEVRLILNIPSEQVQTRVAGGLIVPYVEHVFLEEGDRGVIWCVAPEIWLGPKCDKRNKAAIGIFGQLGWIPEMGVFQYDCGYI
ncbi:MAG: DUF2971 domain-containing protein [Thiobacillus sp.]|nr:DUF2971 domain-containing protein [Thiobacillus sp.]